MLFDKSIEFILGVVFVFCREDISDVVGNLCSQMNFWRAVAKLTKDEIVTLDDRPGFFVLES